MLGCLGQPGTIWRMMRRQIFQTSKAFVSLSRRGVEA